MSTALITGITGQDGAYLARLLVKQGYDVHGLVRRSSTFNRSRLFGFEDQLKLHYGDLSDANSLESVLHHIQPDEIYNLAAMSDVGISFQVPEYSADVTGTGTIRLLEAVRRLRGSCRYYQASSSEMFGKAPPPQNEQTPFQPRSPYGCAKVFSYHATINYREAYGIHASNGILFNHESPIRGDNFVTQKIARAVARIKQGEQRELHLGNLNAHRDWGFAGDFVEAMWLMLQQPEPGDYVVATGESHTVKEFAEVAFAYAGLNWQDYVRIDTALFRPTEVDYLLGDPSKAKRVLGWEPKVKFKELVKMMVESFL